MESPAAILPASAARFGQKTALVTATRTLTYAELDELSNRLAAGLAKQGVEPGQPVSIYAQNGWEWVVSYYGALKAGAVVNPVNGMLTLEELVFMLRDCGAAALLVGADFAAKALPLVADLKQLRCVVAFSATAGAMSLDELLADSGPVPQVEVDPDSVCTIGYTSGTTGHPKGAMQSHRAVLLSGANIASMHCRTSSDVVVTALPLPHVYGTTVLNATFLAGGTLVLMERFNPGEALRLIGKHRATLFDGVPAMYSMMLADPALADSDLSSLTRCIVGGQTMPVATTERWEQRSGAPLIELWGMTEVAGLGTTHALYAPGVRGSIGVSVPGVELRIANLADAQRTVPCGEAGELMVRGPIVMLGYYNNPKATAETIEQDGWLHTGDIATMNKTGHVFIVDRRKDMVITGGYNVYPAEIERVLAGHPAVAMVAVGPVPDPVKGELACAYVVRTSNADIGEQELIDYAGKHLAAYKRPRLVRFVESLPTTSSGKVMRRELIKQFTN